MVMFFAHNYGLGQIILKPSLSDNSGILGALALVL
jgi:hypothetical protein